VVVFLTLVQKVVYIPTLFLDLSDFRFVNSTARLSDRIKYIHSLTLFLFYRVLPENIVYGGLLYEVRVNNYLVEYY